MNARTITITSVTNGYIVKVGCQTFVKENVNEMMNELTAYLKSPEVVEEIYAKKYGLNLVLREPSAARAMTATKTMIDSSPGDCASA